MTNTGASQYRSPLARTDIPKLEKQIPDFPVSQGGDHGARVLAEITL
jgi:hypothetical protein